MAPFELKSKLPNVGESIFTKMTQLAHTHQAINLGQGFPDFEMDPHLQDLVHRAMRQGHNQYAHPHGYKGLREILAQKMSDLYAVKPDPETEITVTPGGTYALSNALTAMLQPGDEVLVFEPCFDSYLPNIEVMGAKAVRIPLTFPGYQIPWNLVKEAVNSRTRFILINSPHNPTGSILAEADFENLQNLVAGTEILILSDEVYEHLTFDGNRHLSILDYPQLFERSFIAFSLGKVFHCTGWKIGYSVAPAWLSREFRAHHQFNVFSVHHPSQVAMAQYLTDPSVYLSLSGFFQRKRDLLLAEMGEETFTPLPSSGSYFQCYTFPQDWAISDQLLAEKLTVEAGVTCIPVSAFYAGGIDHGVLRLCFAKKDETLKQAAGRLRTFSLTK